VGMDPQKSLSPSASGRRRALPCPHRSHLAGFELGTPPARVLIVALAVPAEMTDRGQFCRLTIIVLLIAAMTFTGKPLQSHYLLMLNSATLKLHSLSASPGMKPSGYGLVYHICNHAASRRVLGGPARAALRLGLGFIFLEGWVLVFFAFLVLCLLILHLDGGCWRMQPSVNIQALPPQN